MVESPSNHVLQFPIYWFNCPPLLKKWLDNVLTYGWAHGSNGGDKLKNRKAALAVSAGSKKKIIVKMEDITMYLIIYYLLLKLPSYTAMQIIVRSLRIMVRKTSLVKMCLIQKISRL